VPTYKTKLRNYEIRFPNSEEYHIIKNEIFNSDAYDFETSTAEPVIIDCGAHIGLSVLYFKTLFSNAQIHAFEPNPEAFKFLEENISINNLSNVKVYRKAVDTKAGCKSLFIDLNDYWFSNSSYSRGTWKGAEKDVTVEIETVDIKEVVNNLLKTHKFIDLLKLDIEGYEVKIIKHIQEQLKDIKNLIVEYHPVNKKEFTKTLSQIQKYYRNIEYISEGKSFRKPDLNNLFVVKAFN